MRLVNVKAVLALAGDIADGHFKPEVKLLEERLGSDYAILSHCWGTDEEEVQFKEMDNLTTVDRATREKIMARSGYQKILKSCEQASAHNLDWLWVDTCCINKESSSELSEAINSMYPWYKRSKKCYAFLHDVEDPVFPRVSNEAVFSRDLNGWPRWFSRGWTLQELVAPNDVHFFNSSWVDIGNKKCLASTLEIITRIPTSILQDGLSAKPPSVAQVMSWAADRRTRRMEDKAYSLLGLLDVHMPMLYGEGKKAFRRLQVEVLRTYNDHTIFAWGHSRKTGWSSSFLADDPSQFRDCSSIVKMEFNQFIRAVKLKRVIPDEELCKVTDSGNSERLETFSVSNAGIQIWLPIKSCHGSCLVAQGLSTSFHKLQLYKARLSCCNSPKSRPVTIFLAQFENKYFRHFGDFKPDLDAKPQFQQLFLPYQNEIYQDDFRFQVDLKLWSGSIRHSNFPTSVRRENSITLTSTEDCAVVVCENTENNTRLAVALSYCLGQAAVDVICDNQGSWNPQLLCRRIRRETLRWTHRMVDSPLFVPAKRHPCGVYLVKRVHFPRSIQDVKMTYEQLPQSRNSCRVTIEISQCTGCCTPIWQEVNDTCPADSTCKRQASAETTREWFAEIRRQFDSLLYSTNNEKGAAIKFFTKMFGGGYFDDFVGDIAFFKGMPFTTETEVNDKISIDIERDSGRSKTAVDSRITVLVQKVIEGVLVDADGFRSMFSSWFNKVTDMKYTVEALRSECLGAEVLQIISASYKKSYETLHHTQKNTNDISAADTHRMRIRSLIREVEGLKQKLYRVNDDCERRALEEDVTGKILLICWEGVHFEIGSLLGKVVDFVVNDQAVDIELRETRAKRLRDIGGIFADVVSDTRRNDHCPLRRVMADAKAGISKHRLFFAYQAVQNDSE